MRFFRTQTTTALAFSLFAVPLALGAGFVLFVQSLSHHAVLNPPHAEGVVALTGGADRISDAVGLLTTGHADQLLITGVNQATSRRQIARQVPSFAGLSACCIELGYAAQNTVGNALETQRWAAKHAIRNTLIVVTSNYHMPRALVEIDHALPGVKLLPYPVINQHTHGEIWTDPHMLRLVGAEYFKYLAALVRTHLSTETQASPLSADGSNPKQEPSVFIR